MKPVYILTLGHINTILILSIHLRVGLSIIVFIQIIWRKHEREMAYGPCVLQSQPIQSLIQSF